MPTRDPVVGGAGGDLLNQRPYVTLERPGGAADRIELEGAELTIGRERANDLFLDHPHVSRRHAVVKHEAPGQLLLLDVGSANGTLLNGERVVMAMPLADGDVVEIGPFRMGISCPDAGTGRRGGGRDRTATSLDAVSTPPKHQMVGASPPMMEVLRLSARAAQSPISVLVQGETGTGKELVARGIHEASARAGGDFVAVNCAAIPEALLESELFGHKKGAFTGATDDRRGLFEAASGGTVFLDEIGEMPLPMQAKILRVLQEQQITPVGDTRSRTVDLRVISATHRDLKAEIEAGRFREDLYYRLAAFRIEVPPLRERLADIPLLLERLVSVTERRHGTRIGGIDPDVEKVLGGYDWPGNVRQLQNEVERAVALVDDGGVLRAEHFSLDLQAGGSGPAAAAGGSDEAAVSEDDALDLREARSRFEARHIERVLKECDGNVAAASRVLGISRTSLHQKIKELGIDHRS